MGERGVADDGTSGAAGSDDVVGLSPECAKAYWSDTLFEFGRVGSDSADESGSCNELGACQLEAVERLPG